MKPKPFLLFILLLAVVSCYTVHKSIVYKGGWSEKNIEFINSIPHVDKKDGYLDLMMYFKFFGVHNGNLFQSNENPFQWIRNSKNLILTHNTLKKIGYKNIVSTDSYNNPMYFRERFGGMLPLDWDSISPKQLVNLFIESYYREIRIDTGYFEEFWKRRVKEDNHSQVIQVLEEIRDIYGNNLTEVRYDSISINDTLETLIRLDLELQEFDTIPSRDFMWKYFDYLRHIGLEQSAYNWMIEYYPNQFQKDTICDILKLDTISEAEYWDTRNNGTWIYTYSDNGP